MTLSPGDRLGPYEILASLGKGGGYFAVWISGCLIWTPKRAVSSRALIIPL